jgi:hypothetical protein
MRLELHALGLVVGGIVAASACSGGSSTNGGTGGSATTGGASGSSAGGSSGKGGSGQGGSAGKSGSAGKGGAAGTGEGNAGTSTARGGSGGSAGTDSGDAGEQSSSGGRAGSASGRGGADAGSGGSVAGGGGGAGVPAMCVPETDLIGSCLLPETMGLVACNEYYEGTGVTANDIMGICEPNGGTFSTGLCPDTALDDADVLGCCGTIGGSIRNCYYGAESERATYEQVCEAVGCPLTEQ